MSQIHALITKPCPKCKSSMFVFETFKPTGEIDNMNEIHMCSFCKIGVVYLPQKVLAHEK